MMLRNASCMRVAPAIAAALLITASGARADETVSPSGTIAIPPTAANTTGGQLTAFDISFVDPLLGAYLLADRSNAAIDVIDTASNEVLFQIGGFAGAKVVGGKADNDHSGPNGVLTVNHREIWAGDGTNAGDHTVSTVKVISLLSREITDTIKTGGQARVDEMAFDPRDQILLVANDADTPPFISFISTKADKQGHHTVLGKITFADATNGIEQSQWSPRTGKFYLNLPQLGPVVANGGVAVIDPKSMKVERIFPITNCQPAGMALGPDDTALLGCQGGTGLPNQSLIVDIRDGHVVKTFTEIGGNDEVWFNFGDNHYYLAARNNPGGPVLGVIDADEPTFDETVSTGTSTGAHSVAADPVTNTIYVPIPAGGLPGCPSGCIQLYQSSPDADDTGDEHGHGHMAAE
jgi:hypothetical protein